MTNKTATDNDTARRHVLSAQMLLRGRRFDQARAELKAALACDPACDEAAALIAVLEERAFSQRARAKSRGGVLSAAGACLVLALLLAGHLWRDPRNEAVARGLVESAYRSAQAGTCDGLNPGYRWEDLQRRFGPVLSWHVVSDRRSLFTGGWLFEVDVIRVRALTREQVEASAGPSRSYGYYAAVTDLRVERTQPRP